MEYSDIVLNRKPMKYDHRDYRLGDYITPSMRMKAQSIDFMDWEIARILDQGSTPHCVGFAWAGFGISVPVCDDWDNAMGDKIYYAAKVIDGEPNQETGSTTRSGVRAFMQFGHLENNAYAFATSMDSLIVWLKTVGPIITGTNWYTDMFYPDAITGLVKVGGWIEGGHEWMISGVDTIKRQFHCTNSWGTAYGLGGQFYIGFDDYERLFNEEGDAVTTTEVPCPPEPEPTGCLNLVKKFVHFGVY
jgi:hypothetical protein